MTDKQKKTDVDSKASKSKAPAGRSKAATVLLWGVILVLASALGLVCSWHGYKIVRYGVRGGMGTRIFYDQFHVRRHFIDGENVRGEWAYHIVSGYHDFREILENAGFEIHVHKEGRLTPGMLDGYDIFFIGEQTKQGTLMKDSERKVIFDFIKNGGSMWTTAEHTNAHNMSALFNKFMEGTGVKARYDSICEDNGTTESQDWTVLDEFKKHPVTEGLEQVYFFNGCSLDTEFGVVFSSKKSWSDAWNPEDKPIHNGNNKRDPGELPGPLAGIAALSYGKGKIAVTCDHNPYSNPSVHMGSNAKLLVNAMTWLGKSRINPSIYHSAVALLCAVALLVIAFKFKLARLPAVVGFLVLGALVGAGAARSKYQTKRDYDIVWAEINDPSVSGRSKDPDGMWSFFEHILKSDKVNVWLEKKILPDYDALALVGPRTKLTGEQLAAVDNYLKQGKNVIYLATYASIHSDAGRQLMDKYGFKIKVGAAAEGGPLVREFILSGVPRIQKGVNHVFARADLRPTTLEGDGWEVVQKAEEGGDVVDMVSMKKVGAGRLIVISPADMFMNRNRGLNKDRLAFVDLIINIFEWIEEL